MIQDKTPTFGIADLYAFFAKEFLEANPAYSGKFGLEHPNGIISDAEGNVVMSYRIYTNILRAYFTAAAEELIKGYPLDLEAGLGNIFVARVERNPNLNLRLNRGESFKLKRKLEAGGQLNGDNWKVYYNDDDFVQVMWFRPSFIKNLRYYKFRAAGGQPGKGFRQTLSRSITNDPKLEAQYPFLSYKNQY